MGRLEMAAALEETSEPAILVEMEGDGKVDGGGVRVALLCWTPKVPNPSLIGLARAPAFSGRRAFFKSPHGDGDGIQFLPLINFKALSDPQHEPRASPSHPAEGTAACSPRDPGLPLRNSPVFPRTRVRFIDPRQSNVVLHALCRSS